MSEGVVVVLFWERLWNVFCGIPLAVQKVLSNTDDADLRRFYLIENQFHPK